MTQQFDQSRANASVDDNLLMRGFVVHDWTRWSRRRIDFAYLNLVIVAIGEIAQRPRGIGNGLVVAGVQQL
jgi:hypothetical protein